MILVVGASGFIGGRLVRQLHGEGMPVRAFSRRGVEMPGVQSVRGELSDAAALRAACEGVECVFHCAGFAHAFHVRSAQEAAQHWRVNAEGTRNLLAAAAAAGVGKFVFLSSVKAMADPGAQCVDEDWAGAPDSVYGQAKHAAESAVLAIGRDCGMQVTNLRLALVYGAGGRGNLERMARLVGRGGFPPLPETGNRRSLVHVDDVLSAMRQVAADARANGKTYIVTGPEAPSGRQLYDAMRQVWGLPQRNFAIPLGVLRLAARCGDGLGGLLGAMSGRRSPFDSEVLDRLLGSAWYSSARIADELGWQAEIGLAQGLREMLGK